MWELKSVSSTIVIPAESTRFEVGRRQVGEQFGYISRVQCCITPNSTNITLESLGSNPTNIRHGNAGWVAIPKQVECHLYEGDSIALDKKMRAGTVFVVQRRSVGTWSWQAGAEWKAYAPDVEAMLEAGWAAGSDRVEIDAERYIDFRQMKQVRNDNPGRCRAVKRETLASAPPAASCASVPAEASSVAKRVVRLEEDDLSPVPKRRRPIDAEGPPSGMASATTRQSSSAGHGDSQASLDAFDSSSPHVGLPFAVPSGVQPPVASAAGCAGSGTACAPVGMPEHAVADRHDPASILFFWHSDAAAGERACLSNHFPASFTDRAGVRGCTARFAPRPAEPRTPGTQTLAQRSCVWTRIDEETSMLTCTNSFPRTLAMSPVCHAAVGPILLLRAVPDARQGETLWRRRHGCHHPSRTVRPAPLRRPRPIGRQV